MENSETSDAPNQSPIGVDTDERLVNKLQSPSLLENILETNALDEHYHHHLERLNAGRLENSQSSALPLKYKQLIHQQDSELNELKQKLLLNENRIKQLTAEINNLKDENIALRAAQKDEEMVIDEYDSSIDDSELQLNDSNENIYNEDCLLEIFSYLSMEDMMQVEKVCKKWNQVSQQWFKQVQALEFCISKDIKIKLYEGYYKRKIYEKTGLVDSSVILHLYGHQIKYYKVSRSEYVNSKYEKIIFQLVPIFCKNIVDAYIHAFRIFDIKTNLEVMATHWKKLEKIDIGSIQPKAKENFNKLLHNNKQLKILKLLFEKDETSSTSCNFFTYLPRKVEEISIIDMGIEDMEQLSHFISASGNLPLLQSFELSSILHPLTDDVIAAIVDIKTLTHLSLCHNSFESCETIDLIANMKGLKALFLMNIWDLPEDSLINIIEGCTQLEHLSICYRDHSMDITDKGMAAISKLKKLKSLSINMIDVTTESIIYSCEKLEALWIFRSKMNNSDATKLLKKLTNLRFVQFFKCFNITKDILQTAQEIANERKNNILYITVFKSVFHDEVIENIDTPFLKYIQYSHFLEDLPMEKFPSNIRNFMEKQIEINICEAKNFE